MRETGSKHDALIKFLCVFMCCLCCFWSVGELTAFIFKLFLFAVKSYSLCLKVMPEVHSIKWQLNYFFLKWIRNVVRSTNFLLQNLLFRGASEAGGASKKIGSCSLLFSLVIGGGLLLGLCHCVRVFCLLCSAVSVRLGWTSTTCSTDPQSGNYRP